MVHLPTWWALNLRKKIHTPYDTSRVSAKKNKPDASWTGNFKIMITSDEKRNAY